MKKVFLIDANSIIHRCFHALPPLTTPDGKPAQALYGLASVLIRLFREEKPEYVAACFDRPEPTFREVEYKEYKAKRPPTAEGLVPQIIEAQTLFKKFGINVFEEPGYEADDFIGSFAKKFGVEEGVTAIIMTGDLDTLQLVKDGNIVVRAFRKGISDTMLYDEAAVKERYGLEPHQLADYKALVGDNSDNIKGVTGIGPKTAQELIQRFGTLDAVYAQLDQISERTRAILKESHDQAMLSKRLVLLQDPTSIKSLALENLAVSFDQKECAEYLLSLGFPSLVARLEGKTNGKQKAPKEKKEKPSPSSAQQGLF
jgi:DNA polymerase I